MNTENSVSAWRCAIEDEERAAMKGVLVAEKHWSSSSVVRESSAGASSRAASQSRGSVLLRLQGVAAHLCNFARVLVVVRVEQQ
jgi:hypothetical protein